MFLDRFLSFVDTIEATRHCGSDLVRRHAKSLNIAQAGNADSEYHHRGWQETHDLRADQDSSFTGTLMEEKSQTVLRHVLETPFSDSHPRVDPSSSPEASIFNKLKDAYDACMDEERLRGLGAEPLLDILRKVEKLFPAARPHSTSEPFPKLPHQAQKGLIYEGENQLATTVAYLVSVGVDALVSFDVGVSHFSLTKSSIA